MTNECWLCGKDIEVRSDVCIDHYNYGNYHTITKERAEELIIKQIDHFISDLHKIIVPSEKIVYLRIHIIKFIKKHEDYISKNLPDIMVALLEEL